MAGLMKNFQVEIRYKIKAIMEKLHGNDQSSRIQYENSTIKTNICESAAVTIFFYCEMK